MAHLSRRLFCAVLCFAVMICLGVPARAQEPILTIVYSGNSIGKYKTCPECGRAGPGGLHRRAQVYRDLRRRAASADSLLFISGAWEFRPWKMREAISEGVARALAEAYGLLGCDLGYMAPVERAWLDEAGAEGPAGWLTAGEEPLTRILTKADMRIGIVVFPLPPSGGAMNSAILGRAWNAARDMRPQVDLLIGLSPWGERWEAEFLGRYGGLPDILIGSGPGLGEGVKEVAGGRTLWARPMFDGREVHSLEILARPRAVADRFWNEGMEYRHVATPLDSSVRGVPEISNLFSWF